MKKIIFALIKETDDGIYMLPERREVNLPDNLIKFVKTRSYQLFKIDDEYHIGVALAILNTKYRLKDTLFKTTSNAPRCELGEKNCNLKKEKQKLKKMKKMIFAYEHDDLVNRGLIRDKRYAVWTGDAY